jgi:hypothetical protein
VYDIYITPSTSKDDLKAKLAATSRGKTEDAPLRVSIEPGTYDTLFNPIDLPKRPFKVINAYGAEFTNGSAFKGCSDSRYLVCEGLELNGTDMAPLRGNPERETHLFKDMKMSNWKKCQDGFGTDGLEGSTLKNSARRGTPTKDNPWITTFENCSFIDWSGTGGITHPIYMHGRYAELHINKCLFAGGFKASAVKTTRSLLTVKNSKFYSESKMLRGEMPDGTDNFSKFIDVPSCSESVISNNEFHAGRFGTNKGTTMMIWFNPRRSLISSDDPTPMDLDYQKDQDGNFNPVEVLFEVTGINYDAVDVYPTLNGRRLRTPARSAYLEDPRPLNKSSWYITIYPDEVESATYQLGIERADGGKQISYRKITLTIYKDQKHLLASSFVYGTPESLGRYASEEYWANLGDLADPLNPNSIKKWISGNKFVRYHRPEISARPAMWPIRDDGTYPITDVKQFSTNSLIFPVPSTWIDRSTTFMSDDNVFEGWNEREMADPEKFIRMGGMDYREGFDQIFGTGGTIMKNPPPPRIITVPADRSY